MVGTQTEALSLANFLGNQSTGNSFNLVEQRAIQIEEFIYWQQRTSIPASMVQPTRNLQHLASREVTVMRSFLAKATRVEWDEQKMLTDKSIAANCVRCKLQWLG